MTSSEYSSSSGDEKEEEVPTTRNLRNSSRNRKPPARKATKRTSYAAVSSDEDEALVIKRTRVSLRSRGREEEDRRSESAVGDEDDGEPAASSDPSPTRRSVREATNSKEQRGERPHRADSIEGSSNEEQLPISPKKVSFKAGPSGTPSRGAGANGAARTLAKQGNEIPEQELVPAWIHSLKVNTAMMGDLAAEMRLLRETLILQNQRT